MLLPSKGGTDGRHIAAMMWMLFLVICFVILKTGCAQVDIDYVCPSLAPLNCDCATLSEEQVDAVQLECHPSLLDERINTSLIPAHLTTWLTITCTLSEFSSHLPDHSFQHLRSLRRLIISHCYFPSLPPGVFEGLSSLEVLELHGVGHPDLSALISPLTSLQQLDLSDNSYQLFPEGVFCQLDHLTQLSIGRNHIVGMHNTGLIVTTNSSTSQPCLPELMVLEISGNNIGTLDHPLARISSKLWALLASESHIAIISEHTFSHLPSMGYVNLSFNSLSLLPADMLGQMQQLEYLYLQENVISQLDPAFFNGTDKLIEMNLGGNQLGDKDMRLLLEADLPNMVWLNISGTRTSMTSSQNTTHLSAITTLPTSAFDRMPKLMAIYLHDNALQIIGDNAFQALQYLQILDLSNNFLHTLTNQTFNGLASASVQPLSINISYNEVTHIPSRTFEEFLPLTTLALSHNGIRSIMSDGIICHDLVNLYLTNNHLTEIPATITHLPSLQLLDLMANNIEQIISPTAGSSSSGDVLASLQFVRISQNELTYLPRYAFSWAPHLVLLNLASNAISWLELTTFAGLDQLVYLNLEHNQISDVRYILQPLTSLARLYMSYNRVSVISADDLPASLQEIHLHHNLISAVGEGVLLGLPRLLLVDLTYNQIAFLRDSSLRVSPLTSYKPHVLLRGNQIGCSCQMYWLQGVNDYSTSGYAYVQDLDLVMCYGFDNGVPVILDMQPDKFTCAYDQDCPLFLPCDCCYQPRCGCTYHCPPGCSCYYVNDRSLNAINCRSTNLTQVPAALNPSATILFLDDNNIPLLSPQTFLASSMLTTLYLNSSNIVHIRAGFLTNIEPLTCLYLQDNLLSYLSPEVFDDVPNLLELHLNNNQIREITNGTFSKMANLEKLYLHNNMLISLDVAAELSSLQKLSALTLRGNSWSCECDPGLGLKQWIANHTSIIADVKQIMCHRNRSIANDRSTIILQDGSNIQDVPSAGSEQNYLDKKEQVAYGSHALVATNPILQEDFEYCFDTTNVIYNSGMSGGVRAALISSAVILVTVISITAAIFNLRELIKVWLFNRYGLRFNIIQEDSNRPYDAFISYAFKDQAYVMEELVDKLEKEHPNYKLCVHYRDWRVGVCIAESIIESVDKSRRTLLVLSENFIKSEWCYLEFKTAHHRVLKERRNRIIIIMMDDDPPKHMDSDLKLYIQSNTYLKKSDPWFWEKLRYAMPTKPARTLQMNELPT